MNKIIVTSDWHIGNSSDSYITESFLPSKVEETFKQIDFLIDYAIKNKDIKKIIIAGDLYHYNRPISKYERMLIERFNKLDSTGINVDVFKGNHEENVFNEDALSPLTKIKYENVKFFNDITSFIEFKNINWIYVPHVAKNRFGEDATDEMVTKLIKKKINEMSKLNKRNIVVGHLHAKGAVVGAEQFLIRGGINFIDSVDLKKVDRMFLSHIHKHQIFKQNDIPITYCGSLVKTDFGEEKDNKGFVEYDIEKNKVKFIENNTIEYKTININLVDKDYLDLNDEKIKRVAGGKIVKLKIKVSEQNRNKLNLKEIEEKFSKHCFISRKEHIVVNSKNEIRKYDSEINPMELLKVHINELEGISKTFKKVLLDFGKNILSNVDIEKNQSLSSVGNIKLEKLILKNFRCFKNIEVYLSKISVAGIIGTYSNNSTKSNGTGKTTLMTSILYILFGFFKSISDDDLKKYDDKDSEATLIMKVDNKRVKITRARKGKRTILELSIGKQNISGKIRETQEMINSLIGMDYDLFIATVFFLEKDPDNFCASTPAIRKNYLRNLLNLEIWEKCQADVNGRCKEFVAEQYSIEGEIESLEEGIEDINLTKMKNEILNEEKSKKDFELKISNLKKEVKKHEELASKSSSIRELNRTYKNNIQLCTDRIIDSENNTQKLDLKIKNNNKKIKELNKVGAKDEFINSLQKKYDTVYDACSEIKINGELVKSRIEVFMNKDNCDTCGQLIKNKEALIYKFKKDLDKLRIDYRDQKRSRDLLEKSIEKFKKIKDELFELNRENEGYKESFEISSNNIIEIKKNLQKWQKKYKENKVEVDKLKSLDEKKYTKNEYELNKSEESLKSVIEELARTKQKLKNYEIQKSKIKLKKNKLNKVRENLNYYTMLKDIFGKNGISAKIIAMSLDEIEDYANEILSEIDNGEKEIFFESIREKKSGDSVDSLDIWIKDRMGKKRKYETFSNGEETTVNIAIRIGLSYMLSKRTNVWHGIIVLDEVFGSLDSFHHNQVINVINYLKKKFKQIFVISHTDIKAAFDNIIWIEKDDKTDISRIKRIA